MAGTIKELLAKRPEGMGIYSRGDERLCGGLRGINVMNVMSSSRGSHSHSSFRGRQDCME